VTFELIKKKSALVGPYIYIFSDYSENARSNIIQKSVTFANRYGVFFQENLNSWNNFLLYDTKENYFRLWVALSVTCFMCVEIRPFRCSYIRDLVNVIVYAQCILRSKPKITWFSKKVICNVTGTSRSQTINKQTTTKMQIVYKQYSPTHSILDLILLNWVTRGRF
jgi:hypothetical protein